MGDQPEPRYNYSSGNHKVLIPLFSVFISHAKIDFSWTQMNEKLVQSRSYSVFLFYAFCLVH